MWCKTLSAIGVAILLGSPALGQERVEPSERCVTQALQSMAPPDTTVGFAAREGRGCRVGGYVTTHDPGPNQVLFNLFLPNNFNGRYLYLGVGGAGGRLPWFPDHYISQGFALAGSDGGSGARTSSDYSFYADPARAMDFGEGRGVQVTASATQHITRAYYERPDFYRYVSGCSGGGGMGMTNARRFGGEYFDGFLVGAVMWPDSAYMAHVYAIARHLQNNPDGWISPDLLSRTQEAILAAYDAIDGVTDGIIADQRAIGAFDQDILAQLGYTLAQIATFEFISEPRSYAGLGLHGELVFPGFPITKVGSWPGFLTGVTPPPWRTHDAPAEASSVPQRPPYAHLMADSNVRPLHPGLDYWSVMDDERLVALATNDGAKIPYEDPMDFSLLAQSGAKYLYYHGVDDPNISYLDALDGYETLTQRFSDAGDWIRAFAVPGFEHCRGGLGPTDPQEQLLEALIDWVEKDDAPSSVLSPREATEGLDERSFLLCAEPMRARLKTPDLDPGDGSNWTCA